MKRWSLSASVFLLVFSGIAAVMADSGVLRPSGIAPEFALLRSSGGKLIISRTVTQLTPAVREKTVVVDGEERTVQEKYFQTTTKTVNEERPVSDFDFYSLKGRRYSAENVPGLVKWLAERKTPWRAMISSDGRVVDPYFRQFATEGTLILVGKKPSRLVPQEARGFVPAPKTEPPSNVPPARATKPAGTPLPMRSVGSDRRVLLRFVNRTRRPVRVFWVDYEGRAKDFGILDVGDECLQDSGDRHLWRFSVYGETVATFRTTASVAQRSEIRASGHILSRTEARVLELVNETRRTYGLQPLRHNSKLSAASRDHSRQMTRTGSFSHYSWDAGKGSYTDRAAHFGTSAITENIAYDGGGAQSVVNMWMNSPGHQANILDPSATTMGIGRDGIYWTQMFGAQSTP